MPLDRIDPNYYSAEAIFCATSSAAGVVNFGFPATALRFLNTCEADAFVRLGDQVGVASSADLRVRACSDLVLAPIPACSGLSGYSTGGDVAVGVTALGG